MNRRNFLNRLGLIAGAFAILPSAATYARQWKPKPSPFNPLGFTAYEIKLPAIVAPEIQCCMGFEVITDPLTGLSFCHQSWKDKISGETINRVELVNRAGMSGDGSLSRLIN
jgi:hypothetical protein